LRIVEMTVTVKDPRGRHLDILARGEGELPGTQPGRAAIDLAPPAGPGRLMPTSVRIVRPAALAVWSDLRLSRHALV
jgi:hypothetical protein